MPQMKLNPGSPRGRNSIERKEGGAIQQSATDKMSNVLADPIKNTPVGLLGNGFWRILRTIERNAKNQLRNELGGGLVALQRS